MPVRPPILSFNLPENVKDEFISSLKSENKSLKRHLQSQRSTIHKLQTAIKKLGFKVNDDGQILNINSICPECLYPKIKTVKMSYKDANKCLKCGHLWLTKGD